MEDNGSGANDLQKNFPVTNGEQPGGERSKVNSPWGKWTRKERRTVSAKWSFGQMILGLGMHGPRTKGERSEDKWSRDDRSGDDPSRGKST